MTDDLRANRPSAAIQPQHTDRALIDPEVQQQQAPGNDGGHDQQQRVRFARQTAEQRAEQPPKQPVSKSITSNTLHKY